MDAWRCLMPMACLAALFLAGCGGLQESGDPPALSIADVRFLGPIRNAAMDEASVLYQDGGMSFAVSGGAVWLFGDTFLGTFDAKGEPQYTGGVSCTVAFLPEGARPFPPALQYRVDDRGQASSPFTYRPDEPAEKYRIWPGGGFCLDGKYYVFYDLIRVTGPGPWGFESVASGLARADAPLGPYARLEPKGDWRFPIMAHQVLEADGWLYLFQATELDGKRGVLMARVRRAFLDTPQAYAFYAGPGPEYVTDRAKARLLVDEVYGQVSVAWDAYLGKYLMACSSDFFHPHAIRFRTAPQPWGPWSGFEAAIDLPETQGNIDLDYCAFLHPELFRDEGRTIILTYCPMPKKGFANPEMVEITWPSRN